MADFTNYGEGIVLAALTTEPYIKLHTGAPGEAGTSNAASETDRVKCKLKTASEGKRETEAETKFAEVSTNETITHISAWTASSGGNCEWVAQLAESRAVKTGDDLVFDAGDISISAD